MLLTHDGGRRGERGVVAVIAAIMIVMFATLLFGMIEMMWLSREARRARDLAESLALGDATMMLSSPYDAQGSTTTLSYAYTDENISSNGPGPHFGTKEMQKVISNTEPDMSVSVQSKSTRSEFDIFDEAVVLKGNQYTVKPTLEFLTGSPLSFIDSTNYKASMYSEVFQYQTSNILPQPVTISLMVDVTSSASLPVTPGGGPIFKVIMDALSSYIQNEVQNQKNHKLPLRVNWGLAYLSSQSGFNKLQQQQSFVYPLSGADIYNLNYLKININTIYKKIDTMTSGQITYVGDHTALANNVTQWSQYLATNQSLFSPVSTGQETPSLIYIFTDGAANEVDNENSVQENFYGQGFGIARSRTPDLIANLMNSKYLDGLTPYILRAQATSASDQKSSTTSAQLSKDQSSMDNIYHKYDAVSKQTLTPGTNQSNSGSAPVISMANSVPAQVNAISNVLNECYASMNGQDSNAVQPYNAAPIPHGNHGWDGGLTSIFPSPSDGKIQRPNVLDANDGMMYVYWVSSSLSSDDPRKLTEYPVQMVGNPNELSNPVSSSNLPSFDAFDTSGDYVNFDPKTFKSYPPQAYYNATLHRFTIGFSICTDYLSWYSRRANNLNSNDRPPALRVRWSVPHAVDSIVGH